jgi:hypothetical protein
MPNPAGLSKAKAIAFAVGAYVVFFALSIALYVALDVDLLPYLIAPLVALIYPCVMVYRLARSDRL